MNPLRNHGLLAALAALFGGEPGRAQRTAGQHKARRRRRGARRRLLAKRLAAADAGRAEARLAQSRAWSAAPPAEGYCRGRLRRENGFRVLRGEKPLPYPESQHVKRRAA